MMSRDGAMDDEELFSIEEGFDAGEWNNDMAQIKLVCLHCNRSMDYDRAIDPDIPPEVVKITQPHCDQCWNGDREGETWYAANGREVAQC
jgi:hypothetical protein